MKKSEAKGRYVEDGGYITIDEDAGECISPDDIEDGLASVGCSGSGQAARHFFLVDQNRKCIGEKAIRKNAFTGEILWEKKMLY